MLTVLRFKLKDDVVDRDQFETQFDVVLYPNSVYMMPLATNRIYTHEIVPSLLPADIIPTRLGYVVRSSDTDAVFRKGQTFLIHKDGCQTPLEPIPRKGAIELRELYMLENTTSQIVNYDTQNRFYFSMNDGDYMCPNV